MAHPPDDTRGTTADSAPVLSPIGRAARGYLAVVLGVATGALLCVAIFAIIQLVNGRAPRPEATAQALCDDLTSQRYDAAFALLSSGLQAQGTQAQFIASQQQLDTLLGKATRCSFTVQSADASSASVALVATRAGKSATGSVRLTRQGDGWRVAAYDTSVVATDPSPRDT